MKLLDLGFSMGVAQVNSFYAKRPPEWPSFWPVNLTFTSKWTTLDKVGE